MSRWQVQAALSRWQVQQVIILNFCEMYMYIFESCGVVMATGRVVIKETTSVMVEVLWSMKYKCLHLFKALLQPYECNMFVLTLNHSSWSVNVCNRQLVSPLAAACTVHVWQLWSLAGVWYTCLVQCMYDNSTCSRVGVWVMNLS